MTSFLPPKQHFFEQIFTDFGLFSNLTWKLPHKTIVKIVHNTLESTLKQFFSKILLPYGRYDDILTPKIAFFNPFEQFSHISPFLEYNMEITPIKL